MGAGRQAFAVQPDVSPYFKAPLTELERQLKVGQRQQ